ncbi:group-specific protein [Bacillus sp. B-jedd]|nr:group-specific protein [Bacillus sp. B-jedd]
MAYIVTPVIGFTLFSVATLYNVLSKKTKMDTYKRVIYVISLCLMVITLLFPYPSTNTPQSTSFGAPISVFEYHAKQYLHFNILSFFINLFVFYWLLKLLHFAWMSIIKAIKSHRSLL